MNTNTKENPSQWNILDALNTLTKFVKYVKLGVNFIMAILFNKINTHSEKKLFIYNNITFHRDVLKYQQHNIINNMKLMILLIILMLY